jgi:hypothetical protein
LHHLQSSMLANTPTGVNGKGVLSCTLREKAGPKRR